MHQCKNNTEGNISHLEQMVNSFFPYSQQKLGFDKPVNIVFQSDPSNADVLLGKTAHYDPQNFEVYLYVDKRHPKDILRSLSHELVHHAQNCRGDFGSCNDTSPGYAQRDPHLRKMEREAYTKGNLIFRDFEDLIKRGKITIDINFKDSGEPQMSLKEWKDNELNMLLMKKWGLLKEGSAKERADEKGNRPSDDKKMDLDEADLEEGGWDRRGPRKKRGWGLDETFASEQGAEASFFADQPGEWGETEVELQPELNFIFSSAKPEVKEKFMLQNADLLQAYDLAAKKGDPGSEKILAQIKQLWLRQSRGRPGVAEARDDDLDEGGRDRPSPGGAEARHLGDDPDTYVGPALGRGMAGKTEPPGPGERVTDPRHLKRTTTKLPPVKVDEGDEEDWEELANRPDFSAGGPKPGDPGLDPPTAQGIELAQTAAELEQNPELGKSKRTRKRPGDYIRSGPSAGSKNVFTMSEGSGKISVREAKQITRRIIERIRKEGR